MLVMVPTTSWGSSSWWSSTASTLGASLGRSSSNHSVSSVLTGQLTLVPTANGSPQHWNPQDGTPTRPTTAALPGGRAGIVVGGGGGRGRGERGGPSRWRSRLGP